jgi:FkbM family methyltransferase
MQTKSRQILKRIADRMLKQLGLRLSRVDGIEFPLLIEPSLRLNVFDLIIDYLAATGSLTFFVQIGAHDGLTLDPLRKHLLKHHVRGILVEPQPRQFEQLKQNYASEAQLEFVNAALTEQDGFFTLYSTSDLSGKAMIKCESVPAISWRSLMSKYNVTRIDLLQVDTEGYDLEILKMVLGSGLAVPKIIQFEHIHLSDPHKVESVRLLSQHGYRLHSTSTDTLGLLVTSNNGIVVGT